MKNHKWKDIGALQWGQLGLHPSHAESYYECELCGAKVSVRYNAGEGLSGGMERAHVDPDCPKGTEQPTGGAKIFCFVDGGSPNWYNCVALCEDGHVVASHICSSPGWAKHDLGIESELKHDKYNAHCPNGWELIWLDDPKTDPRWQAAFKLNQQLAIAAGLEQKEEGQ